MFSEISEVYEYLLEKDNRASYSRDNYDSFLKRLHFSFTKKAIHITGTNGKGSVSNYLFNIYKKQGYKVGLYSSPFLYHPNEMIKINDSLISDEDFISIMNEYHKLFDKYELTSFEIETFVALSYFEKSNIDLAIIEVGMGGEIDATNVFDPILSIITNVSLEHTNFLGRSVSEIAASKAGIIKPLVPALVGKLDEDALFAVREEVRYTKSELHIVEEVNNEVFHDSYITFDYKQYKNIRINTLAEYEINNASISIEATLILKDMFNVEESNLREALLNASLPLRFEIVHENPLVILDGAHNPAAIEVLMRSVSHFHKAVHVVFACFKDKNFEKMIMTIDRDVVGINLTSFDNERARTEDDYFLFLDDYPFVEDYISKIKELMKDYPDDLILITGSIAFCALVKESLFQK